MNNPIVNNRIVNDKTFAIRFKKFLESVETHDLMGEEEKEYLLHIANQLLNYQIETVTDTGEFEYLQRIKVV